MDRREFIKTELEKKTTLKSIGYSLGVSKQRIYQLIQYYNLDTPQRNKHGKYKHLSIKEKWLHRTLRAKTIPQSRKDELFQYLKNKLPDNCPVYNFPLSYSQTSGRVESSPSIDRFDSNLDYTLDNVTIISWKANRQKNDSTKEDLIKLVDWYKTFDKT